MNQPRPSQGLAGISHLQLHNTVPDCLAALEILGTTGFRDKRDGGPSSDVGIILLRGVFLSFFICLRNLLIGLIKS